MIRIRALLAAWIESRESRKRYKEYDAGFDYALRTLRAEHDPETLRKLKEQAHSDPNSPYCFGVRIALSGWNRKPAAGFGSDA